MDKKRIEEYQQLLSAAKKEISKVIIGLEEIIDDLLVSILNNGHVLLEGLPGLGKTLLVRTLSQVFALKYSRIQFTPDLMPADITGTNILMEDTNGRRYFEFKKGPLFAQIILADEINRATAKTQSALLEAMQEQSITIAGETYHLQNPFFVLATQNPLELEGTYPLPEAQLDRFFFKLKFGFPHLEELKVILENTTSNTKVTLNHIIETNELQKIQILIREVPISSDVLDYAARMILATHPEMPEASPRVRKFIRYGASPRGGQALILGGKARSFMQGNYYVNFDDIRKVAIPALRHRIILNFEGEASGIKVEDLIKEIINEVPEKI